MSDCFSNYYIEFRTGARAGERIRLAKKRMVIGRHPACDIVVDASAVSRQHAAVSVDGDTVCVEDLRSRNGTTINGRLVTGRQQLTEGDEVLICDQRMLFSSQSPVRSSGAAVGEETVSPEGVLRGHVLVDDIIDSERGDSVILSQVDIAGVRPKGDEEMEVHVPAKLQAARDIGRAIGALLSLDEVLPRLLDSLFVLFPQVERGFVLLADSKSRRFVLRARKINGVPESGPLRLSLSLINKVVQSRRAILSADAGADSRFNASDSVVDCQIRSVMLVPFIGSGGSVLGVIQIDSRDAGGAFCQNDLEVLAGVAGQVAQAIEQALAYDDRIGQEQLKRDLELAHRVQQGLLPAKPPEIVGYEVFDFYEPAHQIGGDFFAYVPLPNRRIAVVLADVSGKGVSAALVMAALSADVRYCLASEPDVAGAVSRINESFCRSGWDDRFATLIVAVLDPASHRITVVTAGHPPVFMRDAAGHVEAIGADEAGLPLGVDPEYRYTSLDVDVPLGTMLVFYTDGISEAMDHENQPYGLARLLGVLADPVNAAEKTAQGIGRRILGDVERHAAGQNRSDDMCLVCVGRVAEQPATAQPAQKSTATERPSVTQKPSAVRGKRVVDSMK